ncbi:MAG TPA: hypothetical protein VGD63_02090 [Steroidobacteraceae bacterium]
MIVALSASYAALAAPTPALDDLVAKNIQARGGVAALHAMHSLTLRGKLLVNDDQFELGFVQTVERPSNIRVEATIQGLTQVQAYNGTIGWQINPFQGRKDPERMSTDDIKSLTETVADFDGSLVDWQKKGNKLEYLGTEDVDGTQAHKIKLTRQNGDIEYVYLDPDHYLEIRLLSQRTEHGVTVETETDLGDYEKIQGVFVPFSVESGRKGSSDRQKLIVNSAKVNSQTDNSLFNLPSTAAKTAGSGT